MPKKFIIFLKGLKKGKRSSIESVIILFPGLKSALKQSLRELFIICNSEGVKFKLNLIEVLEKKRLNNLG